MTEVECFNIKQQKQFTKQFNSPFQANKFIKKAEKGTKLLILSWKEVK